MRRIRVQTCVVILLGVVLGGCNRSPESRSASHIAAGKRLLEKQDAARATLEFLTAVQATPKNAEANYQLARAYLASGDFMKGVTSLRRALELDPKHAAAGLRLAQLETGADDPKMVRGAQQRLQSLLQDAPEDPDALHALALTELKLGDTAEAVEHLEHALMTAPADLLLTVTLAQAKLQQQDYKGAEQALRNACEKSPKSAAAPVLLGRFYAAMKRYPEAEQEFRKALAIAPDEKSALLNLATLQDQLGRKQEAEQNYKRLAGFPDKLVNPDYGIFLLQEGRKEEAIREFERLAKQDPENRLARTRLIAAYQAAKRLPDAQKVLNDALKKNPKDLEALLQRGELSLNSGKLTEAQSDVNLVWHVKPDSSEVHYALAKIHQARGVTLRQREELNEALRLNPALVPARLELARSMMSESAKAALGVLDGAPGDQKWLISIVEQRNWALLGSQHLGEARKGVDLGLASARTPDFLLQDAILKVGEKRYSEARLPLHEVMAKAPGDLRALQLLVRTYAVEKQIPAAVEQVRAHAAQNQKSAAAQYFLGSLLLETGNQVQAKQAFAAAKAIDPEYSPVDLSLAQIDLKQANWKDARTALTAILSKNNENILARKWLGMLEVSVGDQSAAIANFRKVIESQPDNATALNNLAYLLAENGAADEALKYAQRALELTPDNPDVSDTMGWVLYHKGVYTAAVTHLKSAVSKGQDIRVRYHLAMAYCKAGDENRGWAVLQAALHQDPNVPEAKLAQQLFQEVKKKQP